MHLIEGLDSTEVPERVANGDRILVEKCIENHGCLVWALAKKFTASIEDAETVTREIFLEIWRYAARFNQAGFNEPLFIKLIAQRRLRNYADISKHSNI